MLWDCLPHVVVGVVVAVGVIVVHRCNLYVMCVSTKNCDKNMIFLDHSFIIFYTQKKMENNVIEVGINRVPAILLFALIYFENRVEDGSHTCSICNDEICVEDMVGDLSCNHVFCIECIQQWAQLNPSCPCCRTAIPMVWVVHWRF